MGDVFKLKEWHAQCVMLFHEFQVNKYSKKWLWCDHSSSLSRHSSWKLGFGLVVTVPHTSYMWWWKTEVVPQPFRIRYRSALWLRSNFLNPSEFPPCILTCSKKFLPWGWAIRWAISWDVRGIWTIGPTKCHSLSERPPDLSVPQCVTLSVWERRNNFLTQSAEVTNANAH